MRALSGAGESWVWEEEAWRASGGVPLSDRGFRHGAGLFETIGVRAGRPLFWDDHLDLLCRSGDAFGFPEFPAGLRPPSEIAGKEGMLRLHWTAGDGRPDDPIREPRLFAAFEPVADLGDGPASVRVEVEVGLEQPFMGTKTHLYWPRLRLLAQAREAGSGECLLVGQGGGLVSGTVSNVFGRVGSQWRTPSVSSGARPGVVRKWVLEQGWASESDDLPLEDLEEAFLTNSRIGILPVSSIGSRSLASTQFAANLREHYQQQILGR